jgi:hypothetical protein
MNQTPNTPPTSDVEARLATWLEEGPTSGPDELLSRTFARTRSTPQQRVWRHRLLQPTRSSLMNTTLKFAAIGIVALAIGIGIGPLLTNSPDDASPAAASPSASEGPSPDTLREGTLQAGTYTVAPFAPSATWGMCMDPPQDGCRETILDDTIAFTFTVPDGWAGAPFEGLWLAGDHNSPPGGAGLSFGRGGWLYSDPCSATPPPDIGVDVTVEAFANALSNHPSLDVSTPIDITLDGYAGKYLELQVPSDIATCSDGYYPWEPGLYAQGPDQRWHVWIVDVGGVRVVVTSYDYPGTSPEHQAELGAIVDSIRIDAPTDPTIAQTVTSGTADTAIGQLSWSAIRGDADSIPAAKIFETPDGFGAIESTFGRPDSRFWVSSDGEDWTVAPMPVPATGAVGHAVVDGEHWIWSMDDFRLWHSSDFVTWTEVELGVLKPPDVAGVDWGFSTSGPITVGATTLLPWDGVGGTLALDELLDSPLPPGESWRVGKSRESAPELGDERDVWRERDFGQGTPVHMGTIRVLLDGSMVSIIDSDRDAVVARIDAELLGLTGADLADSLNRYGSFGLPGHGAVISDGSVRAFEPPAELEFLDAVGGRFVGMGVEDETGRRLVWASANGLDWESVGPAVTPSSVGLHFELLERLAGNTRLPLQANVLIDESGTQREELWSSDDGLTWVRLGLVYTYPEGFLGPFEAPHGGYLAIGDDLRVHASADGGDWAVVEGLEGVRQSIDEYGGTSRTSVARDAAFIVEIPFSGERLMWVLRLDTLDG